MLSKETVIEVAKKCFDPEIPVNIWDLGLIYDIDVKPEAGSVRIRMSLTTQSCPAAQAIPDAFRARIQHELGAKDVEINLVFDPPWTPERISEDGKRQLGLSE